MANVGPSDGEVLLEGVEQAAFGNFRKSVNPANGLVADTTRDHWPCSIAVVGFALSVYPVAIERGRVSRDEALDLSLAALPFFRDSDQTVRRIQGVAKGSIITSSICNPESVRGVRTCR